ncbi:unnamed protein product [Ranitomeya imitator]|uniref:DDT domain-containing protein n=1 Tax=Ranitomeya imitator TaxID=111125 RepID=A0ABN9LRV7_9NEOB|nr:unnamed protein product [Ranitomeya imitator]
MPTGSRTPGESGKKLLEGIRLNILSTRNVRDHKIKTGEKQRPSSLSRIQPFGRLEAKTSEKRRHTVSSRNHQNSSETKWPLPQSQTRQPQPEMEEKHLADTTRAEEREKIRAEKRMYVERLKLFNQRRDDIECDDSKDGNQGKHRVTKRGPALSNPMFSLVTSEDTAESDLPSPLPVKTRLPPDCFGDAVMVLEFLHAFGDLFDLNEEFPEGMTFEILEEALVGNDPEGPLCELLFFFLSAIFQALAEEEEDVANDQITDKEAKGLTEALGEDADTTKSALFAVASLAAAWPQLNHGCSLKELDLDSCTLSEILRLHILASGAESNSANAKYRYQKQGGFLATDDACLELRINHPAILKKLSSTSVYDLLPDEKLKILHALCGKLLTLVSTRDYIEDCIEELRQMKQEFRELKAEQNRREREEAAARLV